MLTFPGRHGTAIYLQNYLSTMFQVSDVMVDKEEVAMSLNIKIQLPEKEKSCCGDQEASVPDESVFVSKTSLELIASKVLKTLSCKGLRALSAANPSISYILYPTTAGLLLRQGSCRKRCLVCAWNFSVPTTLLFTHSSLL